MIKDNNNTPSQMALFNADIDQKGEPDKQEIMLKEAFSRKNLEMKTDLTRKQITSLAIGKVFQKRFKSKTMNILMNELMALSVSNDRKGRTEYVDLSKSLNSEMGFGMDDSLATRLLGR